MILNKFRQFIPNFAIEILSGLPRRARLNPFGFKRSALRANFSNAKFGFIFLFVICHLSFVISGCGYTTKTALSSSLKTIHIEPFKNKITLTTENTRNAYRTYTPGVETVLTNALVDRFILDGHLKVVSEENADLVLSGELIDYRKDPVRYNANNEVEEYRVNVIVNLTLSDKRNNEIVWEVENFGGDASTFIKGNLAKSDDAIVRESSDDLVRRIVEKTVEAW